MEVKKDEGMNVGTNPFYKPNNASYGTSWQASNGSNPVQMGDIPLYSDIVSIESKPHFTIEAPHSLIFL